MDDQELYEVVERFQNLLVSRATGGEVDPAEFKVLRASLLSNSRIEKSLPRFVRTTSDPKQFFTFIQSKSPSYQGRREYLWEQFRPILQSLEPDAQSPGDGPVGEALAAFDPDQIHELWQRALERRVEDPAGAITLARTLLESVSKYILDQQTIEYASGADLPALYRAAAESLDIAPGQQSDRVMKQILGGATAVVEGLGALRSKLGDAHGKGVGADQPAPRHAKLAVNLAGAMATFLCDTFAERNGKKG